jgi:hypothetical protein
MGQHGMARGQESQSDTVWSLGIFSSNPPKEERKLG